MPIDSIGTIASQTNQTNEVALKQEDFIKLFLAELKNQDPLEPLNNREFLAQMAQFTNLEQARQSHETLEGIAFMDATSQAMSVIGQEVEVTTATLPFVGSVEAVHFYQDGPRLTLKDSSGAFIENIKLNQIQLVKE